MTGLKQMLKNRMDDDRSFATCVSKIAGYANPTGFYKFLNKDECEFKDIQKLIEIVQYAFPEREYDIMDQYIRTLNPNNALARQALEYASINKLDSLFEFLLDELIACSNVDSKEWASVYKIDWDATKGIIDPLTARLQLNKLRLKNNESITFSFIAKYYAYYDQRFINEIENVLDIVSDLVETLKDGFIKKSFKCRLLAMTVDVKFHKGDINNAKQYAIEAVKLIESKDTLAKIYTQLGNMYLFNSYDLSIDYLKKAFNLACATGNNHRLKEAKRSINFTSNYWGKVPNYLNYESNEVSDVHEIVFYHIRNNDHEKALNILEKMNNDALTDSQMGFNLFYKALATKEKRYFYESWKYFNLAGEKFYKNLSLFELKKLGTEEDYILDTLAT